MKTFIPPFGDHPRLAVPDNQPKEQIVNDKTTSETSKNKDPRRLTAGEFPKIPPRQATPEDFKKYAGQHCAEVFAAALLQNPKIDIFLYGSPLDPGPRADHKNAGALLAHGAKRLAEDYLSAMEALYAPVAAARREPEPVADAASTNDFED